MSKYKKAQHRINQFIQAPEVLLIDPKGNKQGPMPTKQALDMAKEQGLDLVEVAPNLSPVVVKILDYNRFQYAQNKKKVTAIKQTKREKFRTMVFRPNIDTGDYQIKCKKIQQFLENGDKVKVTLRFRGREIVFQDKGFALLDRLANDLKDIAKVDAMPKLEGRQIHMVLSLQKK